MKKLNQIKADEIIYCKAEGCYTKLVLTNDRTIRISKTLKKVEQALILINSCFLRIHDSYLINIKHIKNLKIVKKCELEMNNNEKVEIAVRRRRSVLARLLKGY